MKVDQHATDDSVTSQRRDYEDAVKHELRVYY